MAYRLEMVLILLVVREDRVRGDGFRDSVDGHALREALGRHDDLSLGELS